MIKSLLIANRGEIACRIARTAQSMGIATVAVYSDADAGSAHVAACDKAVHIGSAAPAESYLRGDRIIAAALQSGADAIHPGYGFLSENPEFVEDVEAAGLIFVGPSADAIRAMGLKDNAKTLMAAAGVPVVPGYHGADQDDALLAQEAEKIGYPVLIKAVAGGGGKGMRLVDTASEFQVALERARAEAQGAFGNDDVLIEKFVQSPRHIEVQVFGDGTQAVHLFERDCSLQRRHQKVIEEAPAPGMTDEMRNAMGLAAVKAAEAISYKGAGTVEFIVDGSDGLQADKFWFMEMNTRLQVEHPVTEAITGVDLVAWQLKVAGGAPLPMNQDQLSISGHAFEARLYAEDVPAGFLPATGRLSHLHFPEGARADSGVRSGDEISPHYDPMISKLIVHGPDRATALRQLSQALEQTQVAGTVTNLAFLGALAGHTGFAAADVDTGLIGRDIDALSQVPEPSAQGRAQAALVAAKLWDGIPQSAGFALWEPLAQALQLVESGEVIDLTLHFTSKDTCKITLGDQSVTAAWQGGQWSFDGNPALDMHVEADTITVFTGYGQTWGVVDPLDRGGDSAGTGNETLAPMPGRIVSVSVKAGQVVQEGDPMVVLEAMKMEHVMTAAREGTVAEVLVAQGDQVAAQDALILLEETE